MNYTNLNIKTTDKTFKYIVEYYDDPAVNQKELPYFQNEFGYFFYDNLQTNVLHEKNYWTIVDNDILEHDACIPDVYNVSSFRLYFPRFSVETYEHNTFYVMTISTWINGTQLFLGSYLLDRRDAIASETGVKKFLNEEYYEYLEVKTIDPYYLLYGDEWKEFRQNFCGEKVYLDGSQKNNSAANINITLTPVKNIDGIWIKLDGYDSTQSTILLNTKEHNYMRPLVTFDNEDGNPKFDCEVVFNELYEGNFEEYLKETYQIVFDETYTLGFDFFIGDKSNIYKAVVHTYNTPVQKSIFELSEFKFDSWNEYIDGVSAWVVMYIKRGDAEVLTISSNEVFVTREIFKYLMEMPIGNFEKIVDDGTNGGVIGPHIGHTGITGITGKPPIVGGGLRSLLVREQKEIRKIDLDTLEMETPKFDVVNIIHNEIVSVERPNEHQSNMVRPVFVKVQEAEMIRLHKGVTENICINLDAYKNKVDVFVLKVGEANFYEIGRINSGIVFKVIGTSLPEDDGTYYILNEDGELVTTGNYTLA